MQVQYTLFEVLPSLVNIEQPTTLIVSEVSNNAAEPDSPLEKSPLLDEEVVVVRQEPITNSIFGTLRYLGTVGGRVAHYRGFWIGIAYHVFHGIITNILFLLLGQTMFAPAAIAFICHPAATVLACELHMNWTHIVISPPSPLPWYKRLVRSRYHFKSLALPSLKVAVAHQLVIIMPAITFFAWGPIPEGEAMRNDLIFRGLAVAATGLAAAFFVLLPASVYLTRVEASLLPEDVDTIVAFDRTLGGRVAADSKWSVRYIAVIASLSNSDRFRIAKYYIKAACMMAVIAANFIVIPAMEIDAFGPDRVVATLRGFWENADGIL